VQIGLLTSPPGLNLYYQSWLSGELINCSIT
jgi:hypothetical protein